MSNLWFFPKMGDKSGKFLTQEFNLNMMNFTSDKHLIDGASFVFTH